MIKIIINIKQNHKKVISLRNSGTRVGELVKQKEINPVQKVIKPRADLHEYYLRQYEKTMIIYDKLKDEFQ